MIYCRRLKSPSKKRKHGRPIRLELLQKCDKQTKEFLCDALKVKNDEIYETPGPIDLTFCLLVMLLTAIGLVILLSASFPLRLL